MNVITNPVIEIEDHGNYVSGREVEAGDGAWIDVHNPATGAVIARIPHSNAADVDRAMKSARAAFESREWGGLDIRARSRLVNRLADAFESNLDTLYRLETMNNGRPVNETRAQLARLPDFFRYFASMAMARRDAVIPVEGQYLNYTLRTPLGVVANCTPFNHPLMIMCKSLAAVLATGCTTVVKPSEYTPLTTLKLAQHLRRGGAAEGRVQRRARAMARATGQARCRSIKDINKLVLTGGTEAGRIAGSRGGARLRASDDGTRRQDAGPGVRGFRRRPGRRTTPPSAPSSAPGRPASARRGISCRRRSTTNSSRS